VTEQESALPQLPKCWVWAKIGNFTQVLGGKRLPKGHDFSKMPTTYPYIRVTDFEKMTIATHQLRFLKTETHELIKKYTISKDDVYISIAGSIGKVGTVPENLDGANLTENAAKIMANQAMSKKALSYALNTPFVQEQIKKSIVSTNQPKLALFRIEKLFVPVPPWREQFRIVDKVEELFSFLDAGTDSLRKVQAQLKRYRQAVLKHAFEGKLTEEWRKTHHARTEVKCLINSEEGEISKLPENWGVVRFGDVIKIIDYRGRTPPYAPQGIPHIRSSNIRDGQIVLKGLKYISKETFNKYMTRGLPQPDDILFTTEAPLGEVAPIPDFVFSVAQRLMILRPLKNILDPKFLLYQIMSLPFQGKLRGKGTGTTVTGVSSRNLKPIRIIIAPLSEQIRIVVEIDRIFSIIETTSNTIETSLRESTHLRQNILKNAFEGKLLPQDPSDEPAGVASTNKGTKK
jgi:type I restriction enzyme S subunit